MLIHETFIFLIIRYDFVNHFGQLFIKKTVSVSWLAHIEVIQWHATHFADAGICKQNQVKKLSQHESHIYVGDTHLLRFHRLSVNRVRTIESIPFQWNWRPSRWVYHFDIMWRSVCVSPLCLENLKRESRLISREKPISGALVNSYFFEFQSFQWTASETADSNRPMEIRNVAPNRIERLVSTATDVSFRACGSCTHSQSLASHTDRLWNGRPTQWVDSRRCDFPPAIWSFCSRVTQDRCDFASDTISVAINVGLCHSLSPIFAHLGNRTAASLLASTR